MHLKHMGKDKAVLEGGSSLVPQWYTSSHLQKVTISMVPEGRKAVAGMGRNQGSSFKLLYPYTSFFLSMYKSQEADFTCYLWFRPIQSPEKPAAFLLFYSDTCSLAAGTNL